MSSDCVVCVTQTTRARCDCDTVPAAGACRDAQLEFAGAPDCAGVTDCVAACASDCACVDACYQAHATCRPLADKLQGCIVQACEARCH
jgi:hypothetical protein